jgi:hypothetical protein
MKGLIIISVVLTCLTQRTFSQALHNGDSTQILDTTPIKRSIEQFNKIDKETVKNSIENSQVWDWLKTNVPFFECPDKQIQEIYYFRWWVYRKHIVSVPDGYVVTEFLPRVAHAGKYNTIVCAAGLHIEEGRWIRDPKYIESYSKFWYSEEGQRSDYSNWLVPSIWEYCKTTGKIDLAISLLPAFIRDYENWEVQNLHPSGLFWSSESNDGGEYSISGNGLRPTLNSYMYATAKTIAEIAALANERSIVDQYLKQALRIKTLVQQKLWDPKAAFFKTVHLQKKKHEVSHWDFDSSADSFNVRELYGYIPWKFFMPDTRFNSAWHQLKDPRGFNAPYGLTTAEQRHFRFMKYRVKRCQWDGAVWPFTTSLTLRAMANFITGYRQNVFTKADYLKVLKTYAETQYRTTPYGGKIPWIDEDLHPYSGIWLARSIIFELDDPVVGKDLNHGFDRGKDYNHSSYADLIISDLVGLKSRPDDIVEINPLVSPSSWKWFCLENVKYHGRDLTILYDSSGRRYGRGKGLFVYVNGALAAHASGIQRLMFKIPDGFKAKN